MWLPVLENTGIWSLRCHSPSVCDHVQLQQDVEMEFYMVVLSIKGDWRLKMCVYGTNTCILSYPSKSAVQCLIRKWGFDCHKMGAQWSRCILADNADHNRRSLRKKCKKEKKWSESEEPSSSSPRRSKKPLRVSSLLLYDDESQLSIDLVEGFSAKGGTYLSSTFASNFLRQQDLSSSSFIHWSLKRTVIRSPGMCASSSTITSLDDVWLHTHGLSGTNLNNVKQVMGRVCF
jgi:hypothetical protein